MPIIVPSNRADPLALGYPANAAPWAVGGVQTLTANRAVFWRVVGAGTITSLQIRVSVQSGNICAGVYTNSGTGLSAVPLTRVATTGSIACPAVGLATLTLDVPVSVSHGSHWLAFAGDDATASFVLVNNGVVATPANGWCYYKDTAFPLPTPAASLTTGIVRIPYMIGV